MIPKYIIIHCSATPVNKDFTVKDITRMHQQRGFRTIGYHFYITKNGIVYPGRSETEVGAHCLGWNANSIGICYEGGINEKGECADTRTPEQKMAIIKLIKKLCIRYPIEMILGHRDTSPDLNGNGEIEPSEWIKICPCFNAKVEYNYLCHEK